MVAGVGGPVATESTARSTLLIEAGEQGSRGAEEKNLVSSPSPITHHPSPLEDDDDDEEVSWQSAARASLEKNKPLNVKAPPAPVAKRVEPTPQPQKAPAKTEGPSSVISKNTSEPTNKPTSQKETPSSPLSSSAPTTPQPQAPEELPPIEAQFTQEELPSDFWGSAPEPPPTDSYDDELFETATSAPRQSPESNFGQSRTPKPASKLPFDMPLFNELQGLFPGKILRIDMKQQKQPEESEESAAPSNEAVNVAESEESE